MYFKALGIQCHQLKCTMWKLAFPTGNKWAQLFHSTCWGTTRSEWIFVGCEVTIHVWLGFDRLRWVFCCRFTFYIQQCFSFCWISSITLRPLFGLLHTFWTQVQLRWERGALKVGEVPKLWVVDSAGLPTLGVGFRWRSHTGRLLVPHRRRSGESRAADWIHQPGFKVICEDGCQSINHFPSRKQGDSKCEFRHWETGLFLMWC